MTTDSLRFEKKDGIATVVLNRPQFGNTIDGTMVAGWSRIAETIRADESLKVVVITGSGEEAFCRGAEADDVNGMGDSGDGSVLQPLTPVLDSIDLPKIAAINGAAIGQGLELALACDLRLCSSTAVFALPQITGGEIPWDGGTQRLRRVVGLAKSLEMILLGETIDAVEAYRIGLVNRVVPGTELQQVCFQLAQRIADQGSIAVRYVREAIQQGMDLTLEQGLRLEADLYYLLHTTQDREEGILAFREKRRPRFQGN